jgi:DNA-directed RNA polymerase subunit RPC12/RpoP
VTSGWSELAEYRGGVTTRYRCSACGNLTRFDVTSTRTTKAFHHFTVGGDLVVEDEEVVEESVHEVACRWCGHGRSVEVLEEEDSSGNARAIG